MLAGRHAIGDIFVLKDGGEGRIVLDPAQSTYATLGLSSATRSRMREVVFNGPGIVFDPLPSGACRESLTTCAKPSEKSKRSPNQASKPDQV
jgi:hypothetical protein